MNLENQSEHEQTEKGYTAKSKKPIILAVVACALAAIVVAVIIMSIIDRENRENAEELCMTYNSLVSAYNDAAKQYNDTLDKMSEYQVERLPDPVNLKTEISSDTIGRKQLKTLRKNVEEVETETAELQQKITDVYVLSINYMIDDFNLIAGAYNESVQITSIDFIDGLPEKIDLKTRCNQEDVTDEDSTCQYLEQMREDTESLVEEYLVVQQITAPTEEWVIDRLKSVSSITDVQAVTQEKDPNGLLGKDGGYIGCVYFLVKDIDADLVSGDDIVDKGTDAGGAIEVYATKEAALNRCDYLAQFDGTLLYSGSYAIIGTMVVRTSYLLTDEQQVNLTTEITEQLTKVFNNG